MTNKVTERKKKNIYCKFNLVKNDIQFIFVKQFLYFTHANGNNRLKMIYRF